MRRAALLLLAAIGATAAAAASLRDAAPTASLLESFDEGWQSTWVHSSADKYTGRFETTNDSDAELRVPGKSKHYGLTALLPSPLDPSEGVVVQYEATFTSGYNCGGSYVKLLTHTQGFQPEDLVDTTPYSIMFGPDKCGDPSGKIHMILRHRNPVTGEISEKHLKPHPTPITDSLPHVYTLSIKPDNTFEVLVDGEVKGSGSLLEALDPSINPAKEIPDPEDVKPEDWVDEEKMADPTATQPEDWDMRPEIPDASKTKPKGWLDNEPATIPDPAAKLPADWDEDEDGEWEAPLIPNPKCKKAGCGEWKQPMKKNPAYKGKWQAPLIDNPDYKGPWVQKTIPNPDYYEDEEPLKNIGKIGAIAFEIWTVDDGYQFDNIYVGSDAKEASTLRTKFWKPKFTAKKKAADAKANAAAEEAGRKARKDAEEKAKNAPKSLTQNLADQVVKFLKSDKVGPLKPTFKAMTEALERTPVAVYGVLAGPVVLVLTLLIAVPGVVAGKQRKLRAVQHATEQAQEGEVKAEGEETAAREEAAAEVKREKVEQAEEEEEEEEDIKMEPTDEILADEDENEGAGVRRRPPRA